MIKSAKVTIKATGYKTETPPIKKPEQQKPDKKKE
jgi:hypothetical protein